MSFSTATKRRSCCGSQTRAPVQLAQGTDLLRLLRAFAAGAMYCDPGIKLKNASTDRPKHKKRSQFRVASRNIAALYETMETVACEKFNAKTPSRQGATKRRVHRQLPRDRLAPPGLCALALRMNG